MTRRIVPLALSLLCAAALLTGCGDNAADGGGSTSTAPAQKAEIILDWFVNADHAGLVGAVDQGFFARAGVGVTTTVPTDPAASLKQVAAGRAEFALSYEPEVLIARNQGVPVTAVAALVSVPLNSIMARADRGITRPRDLEGKTVGAAGVPSDRALLDTVVRADGGEPSRVRLRNVGFNLAPALAAGKVDAVIGAYWNIEQPELQDKGVELTVLRLEQHGVPTYDELVVVTSDAIASNRPDLVRAFLAGLARGQEWAAGDPAGATAALLRANPDLKEPGLRAQVDLTAPLLAPAGRRPLQVVPSEWAGFARWLISTGQIEPHANRDLGKAVTDAFLPQG